MLLEMTDKKNYTFENTNPFLRIQYSLNGITRVNSSEE